MRPYEERVTGTDPYDAQTRIDLQQRLSGGATAVAAPRRDPATRRAPAGVRRKSGRLKRFFK